VRWRWCRCVTHHALPDSLTSLLGAAVLWAAWQIAQRDRWQDYLWAGAFVGLLLATKFNGAMCALAVVAAHGWRCGLRRLFVSVRLWTAGLVAAGVCVLVSPYLLLAYDDYLGVASYQLSSLDFSMRQTSPWWWIPRGLATQELLVGGWILAGIVLALVRRRAIDIVALAAIVPAGVYIGSWTRESLHYLLPYYPFLLLLGGGCLYRSVSPTRAVPTLRRRRLCDSGAESVAWRRGGKVADVARYARSGLRLD
jgi:hypothetical protein